MYTAGGKYTFVDERTRIKVLLYGKPSGIIQRCYNAIRSLLCELDAARVVLQAARELGASAPVSIKVALEKHDRLVYDYELPSDWCKR